MKTAQFGDSFPPIMDGVCVTIMNYAKWLQEKYGDCTVVAPRVHGYVDQTPYKVCRFSSVDSFLRRPYRLGLPALDYRFRRELRAVKCDLVHTHSPYIAGEQALKLARRLDVPLVASFHSKFRDDFLVALKSDALADMMVHMAVRLFEKADAVWTVNRQSANTLRDYGYHGNIEIFPNGCDTFTPGDTQAHLNSINTEYALNPEEELFIFVGQQVWHKNIKLILDASAIFFQTHTGRLALIGEGADQVEIRKYAEECAPLRGRVIFTGKILNREKLFSFYNRAWALIFPSLYDNAPLVVREAASAGCPSVLARGSHAAEDFVEDREVFLCGTTPESLARKMCDIVDNQTLYQTVKEGCVNIATPWEQIVDRVAERYTELIETRHIQRARAR